MNEIKALIGKLKELVNQESWKEATEMAKQISALVEPNLNWDKYQRIFNSTTAFANSYPGMKYYRPENLEKREKFKDIYRHYHELHLQNIINLEQFLNGTEERP